VLLGRGKKNQIFPDLILEAVWETFSKKPSEKSDKYHQAVFQKLQYFDPDTKEGILNDLLQIETESMRQNDRLRHVREKIMDLVDRRAAADNLRQLTNQNDDKGSKGDNASDRRLELALADCDIQIATLRTYIGGKYGDKGRDDWFCMYSYLSEFFNDKMVADSAADPVNQFFFEGEALEPTKENFQICRDKCLDAYIDQQFDIPTGNSNRLLKFLRNISRKPVWRKLIS
jgi:hypothetical protein